MRIWKEKRKRRKDFGSWNRLASPMYRSEAAVEKSSDNLLVEWAYFVEVCGFTFEFWSVEQIEVALEYYSQKIHPSSRIPQTIPRHHEECQQWYDRIPGYLMKNGKREKVVAALQQALKEFVEDAGKGGVSCADKLRN